MQAGGDEGPDLPEDDRTAQDESGEDSNLEEEQKGVDRPGIDQLLAADPRPPERCSAWPWLPLPAPDRSQALLSVGDVTSGAALASVGRSVVVFGSLPESEVALFLNSSWISLEVLRNSRMALPIAPPTSGSFPGP